MIIESLSYSFFQNALLVGLLSSVACGLIGSYVIIKRISFISGSIAHASFGGIGLSFYLGFNPISGAILFGVGSAWFISLIRHKFKQQEETLIGIVWALGMAIGIIFVHLTAGYTSDLFSYLFGNILFTTQEDIGLIIGLNILILALIVLFYRAFQAITFDENYAKVLNLPVKTLNLLLLTLTAITTVILIKVVGVILVIALLTLPAATALNFSNKLKNIQILAIIFGCISTTTGIFLSNFVNIPSGPAIIFIATFFYFLSLIKTKLN